MTFDDLTTASCILRKYAIAVESKLYMYMKTDEAFTEIRTANRLASLLDSHAASLNTLAPEDE